MAEIWIIEFVGRVPDTTIEGFEINARIFREVFWQGINRQIGSIEIVS